MEQHMDILVKGMVCDRCKSVIVNGISNLGYRVKNASLGKLSLESPVDNEALTRIEAFLNKQGFEILSDRTSRLVNRVKEIVNETFGENKYDVKQKFSAVLSERLNMNYDSISEAFAEVEGVTIEKYIITRRLERVKELLVYSDLTLTGIAHATGFSSINHLSRQFKELTGFPPSHFRLLRHKKEKLSSTSQD